MSIQTESFSISKEYISEQNEKSINALKEDFEHLGNVLAREHVDIERITKKAKDFLIDKGYDPKYGARPLDRAIQKYLEDVLAEEILSGNLKKGES